MSEGGEKYIPDNMEILESRAITFIKEKRNISSKIYK
jgi:hypothetical protein